MSTVLLSDSHKTWVLAAEWCLTAAVLQLRVLHFCARASVSGRVLAPALLSHWSQLLDQVSAGVLRNRRLARQRPRAQLQRLCCAAARA